MSYQGEGHVGAVNDVTFHHQGGTSGLLLFSCGIDGQVIQWDLRNKNVALYVHKFSKRNYSYTF
jgi:WD40 repeat protein